MLKEQGNPITNNGRRENDRERSTEAESTHFRLEPKDTGKVAEFRDFPVDLSPEADDDAKSTCTSIVTIPAQEGSERQQWRKEMEICTRTELQRLGTDLGLAEETTRIMDYSNAIQDELIELILNHKSKVKDDARKTEEGSWSDVTSRSKRKPETRGNVSRGELSPRRTSTHNESQRRVAAKKGARKPSREDRQRR